MTAKQYLLILSFIISLVFGSNKMHAAFIHTPTTQQNISTDKSCCHKQTCKMHLSKNVGSEIPSKDSACFCDHSDMPVKFEVAFSLPLRIKTAYFKIPVPQFGQIKTTKKHFLSHSKELWFKGKINGTPITANKPADLCVFRL